MNAVTAVARLERAGAEYSKAMAKIRDAVDTLVKFLAEKLPEVSGRRPFDLPRDYTFEYWPSREYKLTKWPVGQRTHGRPIFSLTQESKYREDLLRFAQDIAEGWLDELSAHLTREGRTFEEAADGITGFPSSQ